MQVQAQFAVQLFQRVRDFLVRAQPELAMSTLEPHITNLDEVAKRLSQVAIEQDTRRRSGRAGTMQLTRLLRGLRLEYMRPVARTSAALFRGDKEMLTSLKVPPRIRRPWELVSAAHSMANAAEPHAAQFVTAGFHPDFATRLRNAAVEVQEALNRRAQEFARRAAATAAVREETSRGRAIIALVDAMVAPRLEGDPESAAEWGSLMRQGRVKRRELEVGVPPAGSGETGVPTVGMGEVRVA